MGYLCQCVVSSVYRACHRLIVRVRRYMGTFYPILYDLGIFQVQLDVLSLEKLANLLVFCFAFI